MFQQRFRFTLLACQLSVLLLAGTVLAQEAEVLEWTTRAEAQPRTPGQPQQYRLSFRAKIADGYIIYGSDFEADLGPKPTRVRFALPPTSAGELKSVDTLRRTDKVFKSEYSYFEREAVLEQVVRVPDGTQALSGTIQGQTCYEKDGTCALFSQKFDIPLRSAQR